MSSIEIKKVESRYDLKKFIEFHYDLYEGNPYDVPNLYSDDVNTLRKDKNAAFDVCEAEYYLGFKDGRMVGRDNKPPGKGVMDAEACEVRMD